MNDSPSTDQDRRVRRTRDQWQQIISEYESGSLSKKQFCAKHNLGSVSFSKWYHRLKKTEDTGFVPLLAPTTLTSQPTADSTMKTGRFEARLEFGDGLVLHLSRQ